MEVLAGLLSELDSAKEPTEFFDQVCEALCRLTTLERCGLLLYDHTSRAVQAAGSHGMEKALMGQVEGTLDETPMAQRALAEDRVVEVDGLEGQLPERYARFAGITHLTCTPVAAGGRWFGVIFADAGGGAFELTAEERQTMLTLGRLAALATSVERATSQRERASQLQERVSLMGEIHERVMQRLFGLALALGSGEPLSGDERQACHDELQAVLVELRSALRRPLIDPGRPSRHTLRRLVDGQAARTPELVVDWPDDVAVPEHLEGLAQSAFREAIRNSEKHAEPDRVEVRVSTSDEAFELDISNDGISAGGGGGTGLGLRLLAMEALQHDALVEFGPVAEGRWHVRLVAAMSDTAHPARA